jgi:thiol-disulfide isomerase/thioredoxin
MALTVAACSGGDDVARLSNGSTPPTPSADAVTEGDVAAAIATPFATFAGDTARLADYGGRPVVVNFFGSYCVPCITEMPDLERLHQQYGDTVAFVGLAVSDRLSEAKALADRTGVTYDLGTDPDGSLIKAFGGIGMPTTVLLRADGTVAETHIGAMKAADLAKKMRAELGVP